MKNICLNCNFADVAFADVDIRELKEDDYLICLKTKNKVDDYDTYKAFEKSKGREADLKCGC